MHELGELAAEGSTVIRGTRINVKIDSEERRTTFAVATCFSFIAVGIEYLLTEVREVVLRFEILEYLEERTFLGG